MEYLNVENEMTANLYPILDHIIPSCIFSPRVSCNMQVANYTTSNLIPFWGSLWISLSLIIHCQGVPFLSRKVISNDFYLPFLNISLPSVLSGNYLPALGIGLSFLETWFLYLTLNFLSLMDFTYPSLFFIFVKLSLSCISFCDDF